MKAISYLILTGALVGCSFFAQAQERSAGLRWAYGSGVAFRQNLPVGPHVVEGMLTARWGGVAVTALYERQHNIGSEGTWFWYYGGGMHLGYHRLSNINPPEKPAYRKAHINVGIDLIAALGYSFEKIPLQFTVDLKPAVSFTTEEFVPETFGLTGRWRF